MLDESSSDEEFYAHLHEVISLCDLPEYERMKKGNLCRKGRFTVLYNLLITSPEQILPSIQNYSFNGKERPMKEIDLKDHTVENGVCYPKYLYEYICENAVEFSWRPKYDFDA